MNAQPGNDSHRKPARRAAQGVSHGPKPLTAQFSRGSR
jgi:hypothetical protein